MQNQSPQNKPHTFTRRDIHQEVTNTIVRQLEAGTIPWARPWRGDSNRLPGLPVNTTTGNHYRGINILLLWTTTLNQNYPSSEWATLLQWSKQNERIRKDEKGTMIVKYDVQEKEVDGEIKKIPFLKHSFVFNRCQLASYEPKEQEPVLDDGNNLIEKIDAVDAFIENTRAVIHTDRSEAYFNPTLDIIAMPEPSMFVSTLTCSATEGWYSTLLHELTHWTGPQKRLNRKWGKRFGDENYATEELVAELGAAFLCAEFDITTADKTDHAAYIANWLKVLKDNKQCIVSAASDASKAVDYLKGLQPGPLA